MKPIAKPSGLLLRTVATVACALLSTTIAAETAFSGSSRAIASGLLYRDGIPDEFTRDWTALLDSRLRVSGESGKGSFRGELYVACDPFTGDFTFSFDELAAEWRPLSGLSFGAGRARLAFGPCQAFSPANSFWPRDPFDPLAGKKGLDGLRAGAAFGELVPIDVRAEWILPSGTGYPDLADSSALLLASALLPAAGFLGQTEVGLASDLREAFTEGRRWSAGGWLSADVAGFVLGCEAAARSAGYDAGLVPVEGGDVEWRAAFGANRKLGDFLALVEGSLTGTDGRWMSYALLSWAPEGFNASVQALFDWKAMSARTGIAAAVEVSDEVVFNAQVSWNWRPADWAVPGPLPVVAALSIGAEFFY